MLRLLTLPKALMIAGTAALLTMAAPVAAQVTAFKQAVAEAAAKDRDLAAFYRENGYEPLWTGKGGKDRARRKALLQALQNADDHGLPVARYAPDALKAQMSAARNARARGMAEVALSKAFLKYARDIQTGMLIPSRIDDGLVRQVPYRDRTAYLSNLAKSNPAGFMKALPPQTPEYARLMKEKMMLERKLAQGGWGPKVNAKKLEPGDSGPAVAALRNRLIAKGFLKRSASKSYDTTIQKAVQQFQLANGLVADGVAGKGTIAELNKSVEQRLQSIMVAMERERWLNMPRGKRHILVNLADFHARIVDNGKVTFKTRVVVGKNQHDRRSPEFSDTMEHMVINPTWNVPRSIATKEYLPMLQKDPNAVGHLRLIDGSGRTISREGMDFTQFTKANFPFDIKQSPGRSNALGLVKFMFPNRHNIYLHDTPAKNLFGREVRAYSHGCIRLHKPFEFAYTLLARQTPDPKGFFHSRLDTGRETHVDLEQHVPVHIIYRTAFAEAKGPMQYRRDIYGRDAKIWKALAGEGVVLRAVRG